MSTTTPSRRRQLVLGGLAVISLAIVLTLAWRAVEDSAASSPTPRPSMPSPSLASPVASGPVPSATPGGAPGTGDPALGGGVWYPPDVPDGSDTLIAAANSSSGDQERADIVVEGTAEDEINAALVRLADAGGGQVRLLAGRYELNAPIIISGDGLALVGMNVGNALGYAEAALGSQVVPGPGFPEGAFLINATAEAYGTLISLIHLDGDRRAQGMEIEATRPTVTLNAVSQSSGAGMRFAGESTGRRPYDGYVLFNRVFEGLGIGILHDDRSGDMLIEGNIVFRNGGDGFLSRGASQMYRMNHAYNNEGVGIRLQPGCVRTRLSSNKWEGNSGGGLSIEGGSGFTVVGDTFADNDSANGTSAAHIELGVRGEAETTSVLLSNLAFGKGEDGNPYLIHFGSLAQDIHVGPVTSNGGYQIAPFLEDPGSEVQFYGPIPDPIVDESPE